MRAFHFSLEQLLKFKSDLTENAKLGLAAKVGSINILNKSIEDASNAERSSFLKSREVFDAFSLRQSEYYTLYQEEIKERAREKVRRLEIERAEVLNLYQERLKEQLVLEHLREKAYILHKKKEMKREQILLDDLVNAQVHADTLEKSRILGERYGGV